MSRLFIPRSSVEGAARVDEELIQIFDTKPMKSIKRLMNYGIREQFADLWKTILSAVIMFVVVQNMNMLPWNSYILLPAQILGNKKHS